MYHYERHLDCNPVSPNSSAYCWSFATHLVHTEVLPYFRMMKPPSQIVKDLSI